MPAGAIALFVAGILGFPVFIPTFIVWAAIAEFLPMWSFTPILWTAALAGIYLNCRFITKLFRKK
jgi:hypothetical protein